MRSILAGLGLAGALCLLCSQGAGAVPVGAAALKDSVAANSPVQQAQYSERRGRHRVVKCYREFVVGSYACHSYSRW